MNIIQTRLLGLGAIAACVRGVAAAGRSVLSDWVPRYSSPGQRRYSSGAAAGGAGRALVLLFADIAALHPGGAAGAGDRGDDCAGWRSGIYLYCGEVLNETWRAVPFGPSRGAAIVSAPRRR